MKFKVSAKDMAIFSAFAIFLLYFCAIAVLNVLTLLNEGEFYGFNPFEAFTAKYIFITLFLFFGVLAAIFLSVSSTIFEHQKGFGIGLSFGEKEEKGYSRWLKEKEMKKGFKIFKVGVKDEEAPAGGIVIINDGKNMWVDDSENHTLVIGVTGSGKTTAVVDPLIYSLCKHGESMVFTDPKGEIYKNHAELLKARGYNIIILNFRNPDLGNAWNPLTLPYRLHKAGNIDKSIELVDDVALNILQDKKASDPFWEKSASDYFSGCALGLIEDAEEEQVNLNSISLMTTVGEEKYGAGSTYIKEYFTMKGESSSAYVFASNTINSPTETKGGILSVFRQKIRLFASREQLSEMLAYSDFDMRSIGKEKTAVFMIIHDEKTTYHALATIFIKQCYETLIDVAQESGGKLPVRTNFILDEFANMPPLKDVTTMVTAARSRQIRFTFIIQNFAQLNEVYGKEDAETIRSNCGNLIYILTTELAALEEISKLCGEVKSKKDDKTESHPLISVSDLQKMKMNEVIILRSRMHPFKTQLAQAFNIDWGDKEYGKAEFHHRDKKEINLFDVKEFVKVRRKSKMMSEMDNPKNLVGGGLPNGQPNFTNIMSSGLNNMSDKPKGFNGGIPTFEEFMAARNGGNKPEAKKETKPAAPSFDVDDLVKRIDAKIAELEAQEKAEEEAKKNGTVPQATPKPIEDKTPTDGSLNINSLGAVDSSNVVRMPDMGFNPFNTASPLGTKSSKFVNTDVIEGVDENIETEPMSAPKIMDSPKTEIVEHKNVETFSDLLKSKETEEAKIAITNPIDTTTKPPVLPTEPIIAPPIEKNKEAIDNFVQAQKVSDGVVPSNIMSNNLPPKEVKEKIEEPKKETISTNSKPTVSEDAFFDDFFDVD